jgi:acetyl-CoA C-acetyltransferase
MYSSFVHIVVNYLLQTYFSRCFGFDFQRSLRKHRKYVHIMNNSPSTLNPAYITGWGHTLFGKLDALSVEDLMGQAAREAIKTADLSAQDVDGIFVGHFNAGFVNQDFTASLLAMAIPELRHVAAVRVENACATGSAAIWAALDAVGSGRVKNALVVGVEKMNTLPSAAIGSTLLKCSYVKEEGETPQGFAGVFGQIASAYFERFGDQSDALASISAKNHANGVLNPYAHMRRDLGFDFCRNASEKNPVVAGPLKRSDCSLVSDGAAALLISAAKHPSGGSSIQWRARAQVNEYLAMSRRDPTRFEAAAMAWQKSLHEGGLALADLDFVETHDCFTMAELLQYEAMGLAPHGQGAQIILEGHSLRGGKLPVNPSGGLKSRGHPIGATGVSQHVMAALQLSGLAGEMQLPRADRAGVFNMGGAAVANYVSILERA